MSEYRIRPAACFDVFTPLYDVGCTVLGYGRSFKAWVADHGDVRAGHRVLDVGAGTGVLARVLLARDPALDLVAVDPDRGGLRIARAKDRLRVLLACGEALPFPPATFDRVFSTLALHHVPDRWRGLVLAEVHRVLRPDGRFLLADFENHGRRWVPRRFRSDKTLDEWIDGAGFEVEERTARRGVSVFRLRRGEQREQGEAGR